MSLTLTVKKYKTLYTLTVKRRKQSLLYDKQLYMNACYCSSVFLGNILSRILLNR